MILITGFEPFTIVGKMLEYNPSKEIALNLSKEFNQKVLILPVNNNCLKILDEELKNNFDFIFMLGHGGGFRIETKSNNGYKSSFAERIKKRIKIETKENIGDYYCNKVYQRALERNRRTIFIHVPYFYDYKLIKRIFQECLK